MSPSIGEMVRRRAAQAAIGRDAELTKLLTALESDGPFVVHVHGVAGIGKTTLLAAFADQARARGHLVTSLDCRSLEPTDRGLLNGLGRAIGLRTPTLPRVAARLGELGSPAVLILDHYEVFRLMDTWIRQVLIPALPDSLRIVIAGRETPVSGWLLAPELSGAVELLPLGPLAPEDAVRVMNDLGVPERSAATLNRVARGHPLALRLAAAAAIERPDLALDDVAASSVVDELSRLYLADVPDPITRRALEAASTVRRVTASLLSALLPDIAPQDAFERLRRLPFIEGRQDGLVIHEAVQSALAKSLHASDPTRYRALRRAAWQALRDEVRTASAEDLWRYTADMLYLIENPVVREAFFPSGEQPLAVEPATERDRPAIEQITRRHDGDAAADLMRAWWSHQPDAFSVARDRDGEVEGFSCVLDGRSMIPPRVPDDPVVAGWWRHLRANPPPSGQRVLGLRRWLDRDHGELPCASQAAAWLDVKRTYMELRPNLRRIYVVVEGPETYLPVVSRLGFRPLGEADGSADLDGRNYTSVMLDFGPGSVDGWLAGLVADELGLAPNLVVDPEARELRFNGTRVQLTPLEFSVLQCLRQHEGRAVSRVTLLESAWGYRDDVGSNVVDVVVRRLRRKLGTEYAVVETIRGSGYRLSIRP